MDRADCQASPWGCKELDMTEPLHVLVLLINTMIFEISLYSLFITSFIYLCLIKVSLLAQLSIYTKMNMYKWHVSTQTFL